MTSSTTLSAFIFSKSSPLKIGAAYAKSFREYFLRHRAQELWLRHNLWATLTIDEHIEFLQYIHLEQLK